MKRFEEVKMPNGNSRSFEFSEEQVKDYHNKPSKNDEEVQALIESGFFEKAQDILDVGCGDGHLTTCFAAHLPNASIVGCDVSKAMIEYARRHYSSHNLSFLEMSAESLDFQKQFDVAISFNCLHWIKNQKRAIEQIFKVLKPGGRAFLVATPASSQNDFKTICRKIILSFRWLFSFLTFRSVHSFHTEQEYQKLLTQAGFCIDRIETKRTEFVFKDRKELDAFLGAVLTPLEHLSPKKRPAFLEDFFKELVDLGRVDANGMIHIFFDQIALLVSKNT